MNTGAIFDDYTGCMSLDHLRDSNNNQKIIFRLNEKGCGSLNIGKVKVPTILSSFSIHLKVKTIKSEVRFK